MPFHASGTTHAYQNPNQSYAAMQQHNLNSSCNNLDNSLLQHNSTIDPNASMSRSYNATMPPNMSMMPANMSNMPMMPMMPMMPPMMPTMMPASSAYPILQEFVANYSHWYNQMRKLQALKNNPNQRLTPYKFGTRHSRVSFGCNNQLVTVSGSSIIIHKLKSTLIEAAENTLINTWPGPLIKNDSGKEEVIEYIKGQERCSTANSQPEYYYLNVEKRQIWQLLAMMVKQSGVVSSSELAEFLLNNNETEFTTDDLNTDVGRFRRFLLLGQKKIALDFAHKSGLWGHKFSLAYLTSNPHFSEAMVGSVNDFVDSTLSKDDPIFTLYRCLLQQLQKYSESRIIGNTIPPSNLQQFTILLANGCEVNPSIGGSAFNSEVLKFVVALRNHAFHYIDLNNSENYLLNNQLKTDDRTYNEELLFMNEIYEFACTFDKPLLQIIPYKTIFAAKLYDYGLFDQARRYCQLIRQVYDQYVAYEHVRSPAADLINWDLVLYLTDSIENRLEQNENYPTIDYAYSPTLDLSQTIDPVGNDEQEYSGGNSVSEITSVDSKFEELQLDSNVSSPIKRTISIDHPHQRPTGSVQRAPSSNDHVDNAMAHSRADSMRTANRREDSSKLSRPSSSMDKKPAPNSSASVAGSNKMTSTLPSMPPPPPQAPSSVIAPPLPSSSSVSSNVFESPHEPPTPSLSISHAKIKPQSKPIAPMPTFFVPEPLPINANEPVFDFVSQSNFMSDLAQSNLGEPSNDLTATSAIPSASQNQSNPAPTPSNHQNLTPFDTKADQLPSLNSTTANGFAGPPYMFSPAMSPIGSPDPTLYRHQDQNVMHDQMQATSTGRTSITTDTAAATSGSAANALPTDAQSNEKSKGLLTSINTW